MDTESREGIVEEVLCFILTTQLVLRVLIM